MPERRPRIVVLLACAVVALAVVWWVTHRPAAPTAAAGSSSRADAPKTRQRGGSDGAGRGAGSRSRLASVRGTVFDARTSSPVGGGEVLFRGVGGETSTFADADGDYAIDVPQGTYRLFVRGRGFTSVGLYRSERIPGPPRASELESSHDELAPLVVIQGDREDVNLVVDRVAVVRGRVSNRSGEPVQHAVVRAQGQMLPASGANVAETEADGTFALELPSGAYGIDASHSDYAGLTGPRTVVVDPDRPSGFVDLTLVAGCIIRGRALGAGGEPAGDGGIEYRTPGMDDFRPSAPLDPDGTFRFATIDEGDVTVRAWPWQSPPSAAQTFHCTEGARHEAVLLLPDAESDLDGTIRTANGRAARGAFVDIFALTQGGMNQQERADDDGNWSVYSLPAGEYLVTALVDGQGFVSQRVTVPSHDVALALSGTGVIAGSVVGLDEGVLTLWMSCAGHRSDPDARLVLVKDGSFRAERVPACPLEVRAQAGTRMIQLNLEVKATAVTQGSFDFSPPPESHAVGAEHGGDEEG